MVPGGRDLQFKIPSTDEPLVVKIASVKYEIKVFMLKY